LRRWPKADKKELFTVENSLPTILKLPQDGSPTMGEQQTTGDRETIHLIRMGLFTNCYAIQGNQGTVLVDTGFPNRERRLHRQLDRLGLDPGQIRLIVATHGHADHVGNLKALRIVSGAPVLVHQADSHLVRDGTVVVPPPITAWGHVLSIVFSTLAFWGKFERVQPDIVVDREFPLVEFGLSGKILPTPGHTPGSVSLILETGEAFVGDLAVNSLPIEMSLGVPALAEDVGEIYASWEKLLSAGATMIYPAHGKPFPAERLAKKMPHHTV
jgi:glyoxylase-like metal-dependent hydrolase (beta-lactamase superfamily II)